VIIDKKPYQIRLSEDPTKNLRPYLISTKLQADALKKG
jgi:hypothetical protein